MKNHGIYFLLISRSYIGEAIIRSIVSMKIRMKNSFPNLKSAEAKLSIKNGWFKREKFIKREIGIFCGQILQILTFCCCHLSMVTSSFNCKVQNSALTETKSESRSDISTLGLAEIRDQR